MVYKGFYFNIIFRIIFLFLSCFWLSFCLHEPERIYTIITVSSITLIQLIALINYINKTNQDLTRFFASLKDKDSSTHIKLDEKKGAFKELANTLNEISDLIGKSRIETEKQSKYFEFVVEHIPIGLLSIDMNDKIIHSNLSLKKLLQIESCKTIEKLEFIYPELVNEIKQLKPGNQKIIRTKISNQFLQILIRTTHFVYNNEELKLVSLQDVKNELEENELISWQKLIRVLTHEIMNSITPISTLTLAINKCLQNVNNSTLDTEIIDDVLINTKLIDERSKGLQGFIEKYRSLTKIQALKTTNFKVNDMLNETLALFKDLINRNRIKVQIKITPEDIHLEADKKLIEQILINLIKNSLESITNFEDAEISIKAFKNEENRVIISITDNGPGIPDDIIEQIFIPFFTTKEQGSGIGLSLAHQIMRLHGGSISVQTIQNKETTFTLTF